MFSQEADLFFANPRTQFAIPNWFGVLYLLRRDVDQCMGIDPNTGSRAPTQALWPGAMAILAGMDLLGKFYLGDDNYRQSGDRFKRYVDAFLGVPTQGDRDVIYQLRNALLHSFGLYSQDTRGNVYRFVLTAADARPLVDRPAAETYVVDLRTLRRSFEESVVRYSQSLDQDAALQANFTAMFPRYGRIHIG